MNADQLVKKKCVACRPGAPTLTPEEARAYHAATPHWTLTPDAKRLSRTFAFKDFKQAMTFVTRVAKLAEAQQHHPDIGIHWNKVELVLWTHAIGGLHENDFVMAAKIDGMKPEEGGRRRGTTGED